MTQPKLKLTGAALRDEARAYLDGAFASSDPGVFHAKDGDEIHSGPASADKPSHPLFTKLTGLTHEQLRAGWRSNKGVPSTCNSFTGIYSTHLGLGWMPMGCDRVLPSIGKGIAWIPNGSGALPRYGDIFQQYWPPGAPNHMGISLDVVGGTWYTAEGGQGGSKKQYDFIKRKSTTQLDGQGIAGWVDIDLYAQCDNQTSPVPPWLLGLWGVSWQGWTYYYYFDRTRHVTYTTQLALTTALPSICMERGWFAVNNVNTVLIRWGDTVERFKRVLGTTNEQMVGTFPDGADLTAAKIVGTTFPGAFG